MSDMQDLLIGDKTKITDGKTVLSRAWRIFLYERVRTVIWYFCLHNYFTKVKKDYGEKKIADAKGNMLKALNKDDVPWQRLCQGMSIVSPEGFTFTIELSDGVKEFKHTVKVPFTYKEKRGDHLAEIWRAIEKAYPDKIKEWNKLVKEYKGAPTKAKAQKNSSLANGLKNKLKQKCITWNNLFTAITILKFEKFRATLKAKDTSVNIKVK